MAIISADKIFVGVDDEINFVVEKILATEKQRVILVVPQNALVVSSLVSMRILAKQIAKSKKVVVLVTEDEFGQKLAKTSGLVSVAKVSAIAPEVWETAQVAKEKAKEKADQLKQELLAERGITSGATSTTAEAEDMGEAAVLESADGEDQHLVNEELEQPHQPEKAEDIDQDQYEQKVSALDPDEIVEEEQVTNESVLGSTNTPEEPEKDAKILGPIQRKRRQPKLVEMGGIAIYAGGDISEIETETTMDSLDTQPVPERLVRNPVTTKTEFTGRDWTNHTADKKVRFDFSNFFGKRRQLVEQDPKEKDRRKKLILIGLGIFLLCAVGATYVIAFQLSNVDIRIKLRTAEIPVEQQVTADSEVKELNLEALVLPAQLVTEEGLSISASDAATGNGAAGEIAAGRIDIWNKTANEITIPAGTVVENTTTSLKYVLKEDVVVPAKPANDPIGIGQAEDKPIVAEKFGEEYNITESGTKIDFKIGNYPTSEVIGKRFKRIEGGTTKTFKAPSQEDVDRVKKTLIENITKQGQTRVKNLVPDGYRLLLGTEQFAETSVRSTPEVGKEGENFSVTLEGKMTALIVSNSDLETAIKSLIDKNKASGESSKFEVRSLGDAELSEIKREGNKVTFKVVSKGSLTSKVTEESIKQEVAGASIDQAEEYLIKVEEIESARVEFMPSFVPEFLKRVPSDWARIKILFE